MPLFQGHFLKKNSPYRGGLSELTAAAEGRGRGPGPGPGPARARARPGPGPGPGAGPGAGPGVPGPVPHALRARLSYRRGHGAIIL